MHGENTRVALAEAVFKDKFTLNGGSGRFGKPPLFLNYPVSVQELERP